MYGCIIYVCMDGHEYYFCTHVHLYIYIFIYVCMFICMYVFMYILVMCSEITYPGCN